jgi:hypothetical protein
LYINVASKQEIKPEAGQYVLVNYRLRYLENNKLELASDKDFLAETPEYLPSYAYGGPEMWQLFAPLSGISEGIHRMSEGQTAKIYFYSFFNFFTEQDYKSRMLEIELVQIIPELTIYQESLMYQHIQNYGKVDTIQVKLPIDSKNYKIMYHMDDAMDGAEISEHETIQTSTQLSYSLQPEIQQPVLSDFNTGTNPNISSTLDKILRPMHKGGKVMVAMPYVLVYGKQSYVTDNNQIIIPLESVLIFDITIK